MPCSPEKIIMSSLVMTIASLVGGGGEGSKSQGFTLLQHVGVATVFFHNNYICPFHNQRVEKGSPSFSLFREFWLAGGGEPWYSS